MKDGSEFHIGLPAQGPLVPARSRKRTPVEPVERMSTIAATLNSVVRENAPELHTEKRWGLPWYVGNDLVLVVGAFTRHVGVEFWRGSTVPDPHHLLEGTGRNLRHVKVRTTAEARAPELAQLIRAAVELDRVSPRRTR
jgi:hypothetical protein